MNYFKQLFFRIVLCFLPISWISFIFTPLTIYGAYLLLELFFDVSIKGSTLLVNGFPFGIVEACVASIAYYLLWVLCFLTKDINVKTRIKIIIYGFLLIFIMNIIRIFILIFLALNYGFIWFNLVHMAFWYFVTGIYIAFVWLFLVTHYKIKNIPLYSDIKTIYKLGFTKKNR